MARLDVLMERVAERGTARGAEDVLGAALGDGDGPQPRRRARAGLLAGVGAAAVVIAITLALALAGTFGETTSPASHTGSLPRGITRRQLDAHLGKGVPKGWVPVDYGAARLFVPPGWLVFDRASVACDGASAGVIFIGTSPSDACTAHASDMAAAAILVPGPSKVSPSGRLAHDTVHGYDVYADVATNCSASPFGCRWAYVPALGVKIIGADEILRTLAPSARTVALASARDGTSSGRRVDVGGVGMTVPRSWGLTTAPAATSCGLLHPAGQPPQVVTIDATKGVYPVACVSVGASGRQQDGVVVAPPGIDDLVARRPVLTLRHGDSTVTVWRTGDDEQTLLVNVDREGSLTHSVTIGLGPDGRVAGRILASLRATT